MVKVHRTNNKRVLRTFRFVPYDELSDVLKKEGEAFLEDSEDRPLKRQTMYNAAKKLSKMLNRKVLHYRSYLQAEDGTTYEGYLFALEDSQFLPHPDTAS
jgi:hypothetical protein